MQQFQDDLMQLRVHLAELKKTTEERISELEKKVRMLEKEIRSIRTSSSGQGTGNYPIQNIPE